MTELEKALARQRQMQQKQKGTQNPAPKPAPAPAPVPDGYFVNPNTGQMTSRELLQKNADPSRLEAMGAGYMQGYTYGGADELLGATSTDPDMRNFRREKMRAERDAAREEYPWTTGLSEFAGAVVSPASWAGKANSIGQAALKGAGLGGAYAGLAADEDRGVAAAQGAAVGGLFGAGAQTVTNFGSAAYRKLFQKTAERPTLEGLRATKNAAYKAVDDAGETFSQRDMKKLVKDVVKQLDDLDYVPESDVQTKAALQVLGRRAQAGDQTIGQLDKLRQSLWDRYNRTQEKGVYAAIDAIDDMIAARSSTDELMQAARQAHGRFKKSELLEMAFQKADDQTASTGSGGNILNKYKQAVTAIKNNPRHAKWFTQEEIAAMDNLIHGTFTENQLRRLGKLSPNGNGLMMALNIGAISVDPTMMAVTAAGAGAKAAADRGGMMRGQQLLDVVSGYRPPQNPTISVGGPAAASQEALREYLGSL